MVDKHKPWFRLYDAGVPYSVIYPPLSIKQMFNACAEANPDRDYLIINDIRMPYGLVNMMARKAANALISLGVKKGDRVALMSPNVPQYVIAFQACAKIGAIVVQVNPPGRGAGGAPLRQGQRGRDDHRASRLRRRAHRHPQGRGHPAAQCHHLPDTQCHNGS